MHRAGWDLPDARYMYCYWDRIPFRIPRIHTSHLNGPQTGSAMFKHSCSRAIALQRARRLTNMHRNTDKHMQTSTQTIYPYNYEILALNSFYTWLYQQASDSERDVSVMKDCIHNKDITYKQDISISICYLNTPMTVTFTTCSLLSALSSLKITSTQSVPMIRDELIHRKMAMDCHSISPQRLHLLWNSVMPQDSISESHLLNLLQNK